MTIIYATPAQLANYLAGRDLDDTSDPVPTPPDDAEVLLRRASSLVASAIRATLYDVDNDGLPLDVEQAAVLSEATCAQAAAWSINNVNPLAGRAGATKDIAAKSGGGVSVTYASYADDAKARSDLASGDVLVSESLRVLDAGGMLSTAVQSWPR